MSAAADSDDGAEDHLKKQAEHFDLTTNYSDMETIDALIGATQNFQGGMIVVSHDVHFLGSICKELWVVGDGKIERFEGSVEDYKKQVVKSVTAARR